MHNRTANPCTPVRSRARPPHQPLDKAANNRLVAGKERENVPHKPHAERSKSGTYPGTPTPPTVLHHDTIKERRGRWRTVAYVYSWSGERLVLGEYIGTTEAKSEAIMFADGGLGHRWRKAAVRPVKSTAGRNAWFKQRHKTDPVFRLNRAMRAAVYKSLRGRKTSRWALLVGYSMADLRAHLEAQFKPGMAWANYGEWHVDHIKPLAAFAITDATCPEFKAAWALSNLQPLWALDNLSKGARTATG